MTELERFFLDACKNGEQNKVWSLFNEKRIFDINVQGEKNETGLIIATNRGDDALAEMLIEYGADLNIQDNKGMTALHYATRHQYQDLILILVNNNADHNLLNINNKSPLDLALISDNAYSIVTIQKDLVNIQDKDGYTLILKACYMVDSPLILFLHENGADFSIENKHGESAYNILTKTDWHSQQVTALKERLILEKMIESDNETLSYSL